MVKSSGSLLSDHESRANDFGIGGSFGASGVMKTCQLSEVLSASALYMAKVDGQRFGLEL